MAECSYARCVQQRRNIRRELQRWTRNMVHIVGLERIAEELMGRRKWKLYQESMSRSYLQPLNNNIKTRTNQGECVKDHHRHHHHHHHHHHHRDEQVVASSVTESDDKLMKDNFSSSSSSPPPPPILSIKIEQEGKIVDEETEQKENENGKTSPKIASLLDDYEEQDQLKDWTPPTKCYFCVDGKLDSEHAAHGVLSPRHSDSDSSESHSDCEVPPSLTASSGLLNNNNNNNHRQHHHHHHRVNPVTPANMTTIENVTSMAALAAVFSGGNSPATVAPHLPFYSSNLLQHNWYLANMARIQAERLAPAASAESDRISGEQPLDLSKASASNTSNIAVGMAGGGGVLNNNVRLPPLDTKHIFKAKPRMSAVAGRRTYTEDELQAALRDIQSGKLGTRRAAVIYGIPRSTLRNKVYKLALERQRESHLNSSTPLKSEEDDVMDEDKELSGAEEEKEVEKALQAPLLDILRLSNTEIPMEALKALKQRNKEGETYEPDHSEVGPYIQNLLLISRNILANQTSALDSTVLNNVMPEFVKRIIGEDHLKMHQHHHNNGDGDVIKPIRTSPSDSVNNRNNRSESDMETDESPSNVILKIPSFRPTTSNKNGCDLFRGTMVSPPVTSESGSPPILPPGKSLSIKDVKDVIAQSISQKFQQNLEPPRRTLSMEMDYKRGDFTPPLTSMPSSVIKTHHQDLNRQYHQQPKPQQPNCNQANAQNSSGGKGTRPKRGKYRNYDRDSLVEAVRAVQRGEMSVHRAGSYYGVPHSTLEYKVKERHLMRPRKRDPKPNPVDEKIASLKQNDIRNSQDKLKSSGVIMKPPQNYPPTSPNGRKLPIFEQGMSTLGGYGGPPTPFPFWPHPATFHPMPTMEYARGPAPFPTSPEFFATQMMQKLQEDSRSLGGGNSSGPANSPALAKSARQIAESLLDGTGSNGSFLDGIIRSSLESGVPTADLKALKEDKNVAPENMSNKALLEQLCRNSRLAAPLIQPSAAPTDANSSGDESCKIGTSPLNFASGASANSADGIHQEVLSDHPETIDLSNDSVESAKNDTSVQDERNKSSPPRIYLKKDLANPDNLQPEMLMRFRDLIPIGTERNGIGEGITGSASDNDAPQD